MSKDNISTTKELNELFEDFKEYLDTKYDLVRLSASELLIKFLFPLFSSLIVLFLAVILLLFLSFSAAHYIGGLLCSVTLGFAIVGLGHLILIILFLLFRKRLVMKPLAKFILKLFFKQN